ncbi:MAG TPA: DEAD/DEAH box helicase [Opitutaceae bacterium]|nr:DEAD/DEAH box helicase [Opitutaceae bacterium]
MTEQNSITFAQLALAEPIQRALVEKAYTHPSPIQARAIPPLLEGADLIGIAQTGTGKTAAFSLPMLHRLAANKIPRTPKRPRALILTPTRELAVQIAENISLYGRHLQLRHALVFGGVGEQPQIRALAAGVDIVIATPGRLQDLIQQRCAFLDRVEIFVLDEADRMLDMGFAPAVKRIVALLPQKRQSLLFSATMPESIRELANRLLQNPVRIEVAPVSSTAEKIEQRVCFVDKNLKHRLLVHTLQQHKEGLVLVFSRTKHGANRLAKNLERDGIPADAIHGNKSQGARQRALEDFRSGKIRVLVATDIAARGIDVKGISLVVNFDLPNEPEAYVHRIGRTARAGASGLAIAFCDAEERGLLRDIERLIRQTIPAVKDHPFVAGSSGALGASREIAAAAHPVSRPTQHRQSQPRHRQSNSHHPHRGHPGDRKGQSHGQRDGDRNRAGDRNSHRGSHHSASTPAATAAVTPKNPGATGGFRWDFWRAKEPART